MTTRRATLGAILAAAIVLAGILAPVAAFRPADGSTAPSSAIVTDVRPVDARPQDHYGCHWSDVAVTCADGYTRFVPMPTTPCRYEDSRNCYFDARTRGNHIGLSFYALPFGRVIYTTEETSR